MTSYAWINELLTWGADFILWLQGMRTPWLNRILSASTFLADFRIFFILVPVLWWIRGARFGLPVAVTAIFTSFLNNGIKEYVALPRPFITFPSIEIIDHAKGYSFPSGHAQTGAALWCILALLFPNKNFRLIAIAAILISGFSRPYIGVHYPTDILIGWTLGVGTAFFVYWLATKGIFLAMAEFPRKRLVSLTILTLLIERIFIQPTGIQNISTSTGALAGLILGANLWLFAGFGWKPEKIFPRALAFGAVIGLFVFFNSQVGHWTGYEFASTTTLVLEYFFASALIALLTIDDLGAKLRRQ